MKIQRQLDLFYSAADRVLPAGRTLRAPNGFSVKRIVLAKGSLDTPEREAFVRRICDVYPEVPVEERLDIAHNRVPFAEEDPLKRIAQGKHTLVLGRINPEKAVWRRGLANRLYTEEWCFSVYGFCPYNCAYCYLPDVPNVWFSPGVKVYVNMPEILEQIDRVSASVLTPTTFYLGALQDGLALDPLTAYSATLVPFFAQHRFARQFVQTKAAFVGHLLGLEHGNHTTLSWSLQPREVARRFDAGAPSVDERLEAMEQSALAGYPICANVMPLIPHDNWEESYMSLVRELLERVPVERLFLGGFTMKQHAFSLMEQRTKKLDMVTQHLEWQTCADGIERIRSSSAPLMRLLRCIFKVAREMRPCRMITDRRFNNACAIHFD